MTFCKIKFRYVNYCFAECRYVDCAGSKLLKWKYVRFNSKT